MASIEERNGGFRVRWRTLDGGPRSRQCPDRATARALKREVERAQALGREWEPEDSGRDGRALVDLAADYLTDCGRRLRTSTVARKVAVLGVLLDYLGADAGPDALTREALHRWHAALLVGRERRTAAAYLSEASQLWRWAADSDEWGAAVGRPRKLDPGPVPAPRRIDGPSLALVDRAIVAAASSIRAPWYARLLIVMRFTGLRAGQVRRLLWSDVDLEARRLTVRPELGKSRQEQRGRAIPLHPALVAELAAWGRREGLVVDLRGQPVDHALLARIYRDAGVETAQPLHGIRHAVATHMRRSGVAEDVVGRILGHDATVTGSHYIDPAALWPAMVEAVATLPPLGRSALGLDERREARGMP